MIYILDSYRIDICNSSYMRARLKIVGSCKYIVYQCLVVHSGDHCFAGGGFLPLRLYINRNSNKVTSQSDTQIPAADYVAAHLMH